ncbi:MAG: hypothetical protein R2778_06430 [Saprospiraceae bacterium]
MVQFAKAGTADGAVWTSGFSLVLGNPRRAGYFPTQPDRPVITLTDNLLGDLVNNDSSVRIIRRRHSTIYFN